MSISPGSVTQTTAQAVSKTVLSSPSVFAFDNAFNVAVVASTGTATLDVFGALGEAPTASIPGGQTYVVALNAGVCVLASRRGAVPVTVTPGTYSY